MCERERERERVDAILWLFFLLRLSYAETDLVRGLEESKFSDEYALMWLHNFVITGFGRRSMVVLQSTWGRLRQRERVRRTYLQQCLVGNAFILQALRHVLVDWQGRLTHWERCMADLERVNHFTLHGRLRNSNRQQFNNFKDKKLRLTQNKQLTLSIMEHLTQTWLSLQSTSHDIKVLRCQFE